MSEAQEQSRELSPVETFNQVVAGSHSDPERIRQMFVWCAEAGHLIAPSTSASSLPIGCEVSLSVVRLNVNSDAHTVGNGKYSLLKHALKMLANAAGISFLPGESHRIDDERDPRYVHYRAVGVWQALDGNILPVTADKELDLRDGSDQTKEILAAATGDTEEVRRTRGEKTLRAIRANILSHAQTKAELRAIRAALGIRAYTLQDFDKPWVVAKLIFTGRSRDPQLMRENAAAIRDKMLGGVASMFGLGGGGQRRRESAQLAGPPPRRELPARAAVIDVEAERIPSAPPTPVPQRRAEPPREQKPEPKPDAKAEPKTEPKEPASEPKPKPKFDPAATAAATGPVTPTKNLVIPIGTAKGTSIVEADQKALLWFESVLEKDLANPEKEKFHAKARADLAAVQAELESRRAELAELDRGDDPNKY